MAQEREVPRRRKVQLHQIRSAEGILEYALTYHITPEAPLSALKSAIAENGMGVTSRP